MPRYVNTKNNEFYDLTDPNAPKLIGSMTDYAKTLAEQNFAGYKAGFENPASADLEKDWFIQRESGKIYQDLLRQTEFRDLAPTAPAPEAPVVKSDFDITPGQASPEQIRRFKAGEGEYEPTFNAATAGSGAAAINAPQIAQIGGQAPYFYGADVLGKKANDAAVNTLYRAYFGRDASAAELKNWGASGGADTTVKSLEDFLKSEQIKYNVPQGIKTLTPESFKPTATAVLPTGNLVDTAPQANALVAGAQTNLKEIMASLTPPETEADKKEQSLLDMMASLTGEQGQKAADQLTAEQSAGLPDLKKQFADINSQILTKIAEYNVLSTANQNKPITMASIIGQERAIMNAKAADIGLLQARAQGLQGQISVAQETVNRAIDLKYSTIEARLNIYQAQLNALRPTLDKQEAIRASAQEQMVQEQQQALNDKKAKEKNIQNLVLDAASKGASNNILSSISNSKTLDQAAQAYSQFMNQQQGADIQNEMTSKGYTYISSPSQLVGLNESQITRVKDSSGKDLIFKNPPIIIKSTDKGVISGKGKLPAPIIQPDIGGGQLVDRSGKPIKLTVAQNDALLGFDSSLNIIGKIKELAPQVNTGPLIGRLSPFLRMVDLDDPNRIQMDSLLKNLQASYQKAISGVAVSEPESKRLEKFLPLLTDTEIQLKIKLDTLETLLEEQKNNLINRLGAVNQESIIRVREKSSGQEGTLPANEFDPILYDKI